MSWQIRPLRADDGPRSRRLGHEAFGVPATAPVARSAPDSEAAARAGTELPPGRRPWGVFDDTDLVARAIACTYRSHFGGQVLDTNGLAGVTVAAEHRGRGLLSALIQQVLADGRAHGAAISTLFASAPGIYRRFGFELITSHDVVDVPVAAAASVSPGDDRVRTRRARAADRAAIEAVYTQWAGAQNGPLTRTGPLFDAADVTEEFTGVSLAVDAGGAVRGYASWNRGPDDGPHAVLEVADLIALDADAYRALWRTLGSFAAVVGTIRLRTSGADAARLFLGQRQWRTVDVNPYMLRVDDVAAAFTLRRLQVDRPVTFAVTGDRLGVMNGQYELRPDDDGARCVRTAPEPDPTAATYSPGGLALAWAGAQSSANIRMVGGLRGPTDDDPILDRALAGRPLHIRDAF